MLTPNTRIAAKLSDFPNRSANSFHLYIKLNYSIDFLQLGIDQYAHNLHRIFTEISFIDLHLIKLTLRVRSESI